MTPTSSEPTRPRRPAARRPVTSAEVAICWGLAGLLAGLSGVGHPEGGLGLGGAAGLIAGAVVAGWWAGVLLPRLRRSPAANSVQAFVPALALATVGAAAGALAGALAPAAPAGGPGLAGGAGAVAGLALGCLRGGHATRRESAGEAGWLLGWPLLGVIVAAVAGAVWLVRSAPGAADLGAVFGAAAGVSFGLVRPRDVMPSATVWAIAGAGLGAVTAVALGGRAVVAWVAAGALAGAICGELWSEP